MLEVELHSNYDAVVRGPGAGALLFELTGRPAIYSRQRHGYSVQERTARDAVAFAERLGYDVVVTGRRAGQAVRIPIPEVNAAGDASITTPVIDVVAKVGKLINTDDAEAVVGDRGRGLW